MSDIYFCDTSGIMKLYHLEIGTNWMEALFTDTESTIIISELTSVEIYSALTKKVRTNEIADSAKEKAIINFRKDCGERFVVIPLDTMTIKKAKALIAKYGSTLSIRTLDALQLATCKLVEERKESLHFVCADFNLNKICELEDVHMLNPEIEERNF
jgi:predicted nucleic acid-binding protein